jgi:hypothetical protein
MVCKPESFCHRRYFIWRAKYFIDCDREGHIIFISRQGRTPWIKKTKTYVYDAINRVTEIHRPNGISTYNTYNARDIADKIRNKEYGALARGAGYAAGSVAQVYLLGKGIEKCGDLIDGKR